MYRSENTASALSVKKYLDDRAGELRIRVYDKLPSTNDTVREIAEAGEAERAVVIAREQTAGRGRYGRSFFSPADTGIYMSILLRPKLKPKDSLLLTVMAAAAAAGAIEKVTGKQTGIKWVNDVMLDGRKVCGILTEGFTSGEEVLDCAVVGIGINVRPPSGGFPQDIAETAAAVSDEDIRSCLAAEVLNRLMYHYDRFGERLFIDEYRSRLFFLGREITVGERRALALDTDDFCRLHVRYADGSEEYLTAGEIGIKL